MSLFKISNTSWGTDNLPQTRVSNLVSDLTAKQPNLVSGTNIKTINNNSLLGSGNLTIDTAALQLVYEYAINKVVTLFHFEQPFN